MYRIFTVLGLFFALTSVQISAAEPLDFSFTTLNQGSILFKGFPQSSYPILDTFTCFSWFSTEFETATIYTKPGTIPLDQDTEVARKRQRLAKIDPEGEVIAYLVNKPIDLIDLGNPDNVSLLHSEATRQNLKEVVNSLNASLFVNKTGEIKRSSEIIEDKIIANFICQNFNGYHAPVIDRFETETMLCSPNDFLDVIGPRIQFISAGDHTTPTPEDIWALHGIHLP